MINGQKVLAVCTSELCNDSIQKIIQPLYQYFYGHNWRMIIYSCCSNLSQHTLFDYGESSVFKLVNFDDVDAILIFKQTIHMREPVNDIIVKANIKNVPVIVIDNEKFSADCLNVSFSGDAAFNELVEHLITVHGFKKINCIAGHKDNPLSEKRLKIFFDVLKKYNVPFDKDKQLGYGCNRSVAVRKITRSFIKKADDLPEAIVCLNDAMAISACEYLNDNGISVPQQVTVTGFGGTEHEQYCFPRLTTCRCDSEKFAKFIFDKIASFTKSKVFDDTYVFPLSLDISESCGCHKCSSRNILKSINKMYAQMSDSTDYDKSLNYMTSKLMTETNKEIIQKILKKHILFDAYIAMNNDFCEEEQVQHNYNSSPFTDTMEGYRFFFSEHFASETEFERKELLPDMSVLKERNEPLIIYSIHNQENIYGYMAAFAFDFKNSVRRMQQFIMVLNNCIFIYEKQYYLSLTNNKLQSIQNKIIHSFADLVESRDDSTGQHVKRTGEYVRLLVEQLSKLPKYSMQLTPDVQRRICEAAPLHDIGKIKISDIILNKPGRLTAEEFEIIKTHTLEGSEIIARTLTNIENEDYLKIANEMALYHHEKWDGSGYIYHLSGENIPLSARIMAVVDVFDALTSKRVYKDAFSFDEAISILEESSESHFDPSIIDVFMSIKDKIYNIYAESHSDK